MQTLGPPTLCHRVREGCPIVPADLRIDVSGSNGIDANTTRGIFDAERAREPKESVLGHRIGETPRNYGERVNGGYVDHRASASPQHLRKYGPGRVQRALEVDGKALMPIGIGHRQWIAKDVHARVVHEDVCGPEFSFCGVDGSFHAAPV